MDFVQCPELKDNKDNTKLIKHHVSGLGSVSVLRLRTLRPTQLGFTGKAVLFPKHNVLLSFYYFYYPST
jgi:hypothetical protein